MGKISAMRHDPLNSSGPAVGSDGSGLPAVEVSKAGQSSLQPGGALPTHGRYRYSAIVNRKHFLWPGDKRLAVYICINLEHFSFGEGHGAELCPGGPQPDVLNYAWRDYGNRVGVWRLIDLFD
jgi:hypothetical protein